MPTIFLVSQTVLGVGMHSALERMHECRVLAPTSVDLEGWGNLLGNLPPDMTVLDGTSLDVLAFLQRLGKDLAARLGPLIIINARPPDEETFFQFMKCGCFACLPATVSRDELVETVRKIGLGECLLSSATLALSPPPSLPQKATAFQEIPCTQAPLEPANPLSPREREVLTLIAQGMPNKEIARKLTISVQTVKHHLTSIFEKLGCHNRTSAVICALHRHWIWLPGFPRLHHPITAVA